MNILTNGLTQNGLMHPPMEEPKELIPPHIAEIPETIVYGDEPDEERIEAKITYDEFPIVFRENILLIKGIEGSRKSLLISCILSSAFIAKRRYTMGFNIELEEDEMILHFDTEMGREEIKQRKIAFKEITGVEFRDERYVVHDLRDYSYYQRLEMITHRLKTLLEEGKRIAVIVIDQMADLVRGYDENDLESAKNAYEHLLMWIRMTGACVIVAMHTNRGGVITNGRLGKMLDHKIFGSFLVDFDTNSHETTVIHAKSRKKRISSFRFSQDIDGKPRFLKDESDLFYN